MGQKGCCRVEGRQLSEHVTLGVLTKAVPVAVVDEVLQQTGRQNWRARHLLPRVMVYYVMALTLYAHASYDAVLRELVEGLRWLRWEGAALDLVCKSAITQARVRLGEAPLAGVVPPSRPAAGRAGSTGRVVPGSPVGQLRRDNDRCPRSAGAGAALRPSAVLAWEQPLSPTAPADAAGDRHPCHLRHGHRWGFDRRGQLGAADRDPSQAW